jgi:hypothetical protein
MRPQVRSTKTAELLYCRSPSRRTGKAASNRPEGERTSTFHGSGGNPATSTFGSGLLGGKSPMLWPLTRTVTVSVVPFEIARSGLSEDEGGTRMATDDADGVGDGSGAAQPARRAHKTTAAKAFMSDRRCARASGCARAWLDARRALLLGGGGFGRSGRASAFDQRPRARWVSRSPRQLPTVQR